VISVLHRLLILLAVAYELRPVRVGEPRPLLGLELVVRDVLRCERKRFVDVSREGGGALAGNPVQEVE